MGLFPLQSRPVESYRDRPRSFGSPRSNGARKHAGCDLYAPAGAEVLAVEDGTVLRGPYRFYDVVQALEVKHTCGLIRYGEISHAAEGIAAGVAVKAGQVIGYVGKMQTVAQSMLHFEMFAGTGQGPLTDRNRAPFMRRSDLVDPTALLDSCAEAVGVVQSRFATQVASRQRP
jgi:murein DD-endopeptidase MepM/ murein hydrolase activator NlpD